MSDIPNGSDLDAGLSAEALAESDRIYRRDLADILTMQLRQIAEPLGDPHEMTNDEYEHLDAFDAFKRTVRALGGELEVTVRLPGRTFAVTVPAEEKAKPEARTQEATAQKATTTEAVPQEAVAHERAA